MFLFGQGKPSEARLTVIDYSHISLWGIFQAGDYLKWTLRCDHYFFSQIQISTAVEMQNLRFVFIITPWDSRNLCTYCVPGSC